MNEWEKEYSEGRQDSRWPFTDLISFVNKYAKDCKTCLEVGFGMGANIPFLKDKFEYYGIEGSQTAVNNVKERFPELEDRLVCGDFIKSFGFPQKFDLIVDRASITNNTTQDIENIIINIKRSLKEGGLFIGIDWYGTEDSEYDDGVYVDEYTRDGIKEGRLANLGIVHFSNKKHIRELFKDFEILIIEHKTRQTRNGLIANWDFVCRYE